MSSHRFSVKAVIFDLDGTLIDTVGIYLTILDTVLKRLDLPAVSRETVSEATRDGDFDWARVFPLHRRNRVKETLPQIQRILEEIAPPLFRERTVLICGADDLLRRLSSSGYKLGLVTSTPEKHMPIKLLALKKAGIQDGFHAMVTADDTPLRKPSPQPLLECAGRLSVEPGQCMYVGDMRSDMAAGRAAGMITVGVLTGFDDMDLLATENPHLILKGVWELDSSLVPPGGVDPLSPLPEIPA
jgi:HAD superfamily hydrolase (TIGR01549 family)